MSLITMKASNTNYSLLDLVYPIGSIYMSVNSTSPVSLFGGDWEQLKDRFLLGSGDTYTNGATGGEAMHTLTVDEMPSHKHDQYVTANSGSYPRKDYNEDASSSKYYQCDTGYAGGNGSHNNMPPYLVVYIWKRTA